MLSQEQREAVAEAVSLCGRLKVAYNVYGGVELSTCEAFLRSVLDDDSASVTSDADRALNYLASLYQQAGRVLDAGLHGDGPEPDVSRDLRAALILPPDIEATVERRIAGGINAG